MREKNDLSSELYYKSHRHNNDVKLLVEIEI